MSRQGRASPVIRQPVHTATVETDNEVDNDDNRPRHSNHITRGERDHTIRFEDAPKRRDRVNETEDEIKFRYYYHEPLSERRGSFYGQPLVRADWRGRRETRDGTPIHINVDGHDRTEEAYPNSRVNYPPIPDMPRRRIGSRPMRPQDRYVQPPLYEREEYEYLPRLTPLYGMTYDTHDRLDDWERQRREHVALSRPPRPAWSRPGVNIYNSSTPSSTSDDDSGSSNYSDDIVRGITRDRKEEAEEYPERERERKPKRVERLSRRKQEERRKRRERPEREEQDLRREIEEDIRLKFAKQRQEDEESERRAAEERMKIERETREKIEAEHKAAAEARELEARRNEELTRLLQEKLQHGVDEIVALIRQKILGGNQSDTGKYVDVDRLRAEIRTQIEAEEAERRKADRPDVVWREAGSREADAWSRRPAPPSLSPALSTRLSDSPLPSIARPPVGLRHYEPPSSEDSNSGARPPPTPSLPVPDLPGNNNESDRQTTTATSISGLSDWSAPRRRWEREASRERIERRMLRIVTEELIDPIVHTVTAGLARGAYQYAYEHMHVPPPFDRDYYRRPGEAEAGDEGGDSPEWRHETAAAHGHTRVGEWSPLSDPGWRAGEGSRRAFSPSPSPSPSSSPARGRGRTVERWQQREPSTPREHLPERVAQEGITASTPSDDRRRVKSADPRHAMVRVAVEEDAAQDRAAEDDERVEGTTVYAETTAAVELESVDYMASPLPSSHKDGFVPALDGVVQTEVAAKTLLIGHGEESSVICTDARVAEIEAEEQTCQAQRPTEQNRRKEEPAITGKVSLGTTFSMLALASWTAFFIGSRA